MKKLMASAILIAICVFSMHAAVDDAKISRLVDDCPASVSEKYGKVLPRFAKMLSAKNTDPLVTFKAVVPRACYLELMEWQLQTALQLGHFGVNQGLKPSTVSDLTEVLSWRTLDKNSYVKLGHIYERMLAAGAGTEEIAQVFFVAVNANLSPDQTDALTLLYAEYRARGKSHAEAYSATKTASKDIKKLHGAQTTAFVSEKSTGVIADTAAPLSLGDMWNKLPNTLKSDYSNGLVIPKEKKGWDAEVLMNFFETWKGTPYKWGGVTKKGIDCSGFVIKAIESQFPQSKLPRSASQLAEQGVNVDLKNLHVGDLLFFAASDVPNRITHVGIYMGDNEFAHASSKHGVTLAKINAKYYVQRFVTARRLF